MKKLLRLSTLFLTVGILFFSCSKQKSPLLNLVPDDATAVVVIDVKNLSEKIKSDEFKESNIYGMMNEEMAGEEEMLAILNKTLEDPEVTGIDNEEKVIGFFKISDKGERIISMAMQLKDKSKFESFFDDAFTKAETEFEKGKESGYEYFNLEGEVLLAYDNERAMFFSLDQFSVEEGHAHIGEYFSQGANNSISSVSDFQDFYKNIKDINIWFATDAIGERLGMFGVFYEKFGFQPEGNYIHAFVDFGKEEIIVSTDMNPNKELRKMLKDEFFLKDGVDRKTLEMIDGKDAYVVYSYAIDPAKLYTFLDERDLLAGLARKMEMPGITFEELVHSFDGDIVVAVTGMETYEVETFDYNPTTLEPETSMEEKTMPLFTASISLTEKSVHDKLISLAGEVLIDKGDYYEFGMGDFLAYMVIKGDHVVISNVEESIQKVIDGKVDNSWLKNEQIAGLPESNTAFMYFNINMDTYDEGLKESINNQLGMISKKLIGSMSKFDYIQMYGGVESGKLVLKMRNTDHNSLYTLFKMIDENVN